MSFHTKKQQKFSKVIAAMVNNNNNNNAATTTTTTTTTTTKINQSVLFVQHPEDSLITGKLPVLVQCIVRNAGLAYIECNNRTIDDIKRNVSWVS